MVFDSKIPKAFLSSLLNHIVTC